MITLLKNIVLLVLFLILSFSCKNENSLQQFMVTQQEKEDVVSFDISPDILAFKDSLITPEKRAVLKSIKKANILAFKIDSLNKDTYLENTQRIKNIFKAKKYKELMRYGKGANGFKLYAIGTEEALDEVIAIGLDDTKGWVIVRVTGDNMQPDKIMELMNDLKLDKNNKQVEKLKDLIEGLN